MLMHLVQQTSLHVNTLIQDLCTRLAESEHNTNSSALATLEVDHTPRSGVFSMAHLLIGCCSCCCSRFGSDNMIQVAQEAEQTRSELERSLSQLKAAEHNVEQHAKRIEHQDELLDQAEHTIRRLNQEAHSHTSQIQVGAASALPQVGVGAGECGGRATEE